MERKIPPPPNYTVYQNDSIDEYVDFIFKTKLVVRKIGVKIWNRERERKKKGKCIKKMKRETDRQKWVSIKKKKKKKKKKIFN